MIRNCLNITNSYYHQAEKADIEKRRAARKENVENKINGKIEEINELISRSRESLVDSRNKKLKEIITRENIDEIFKLTYTNEIGEKEILMK
jgi:hypothetical protein